MNERWNIEFKRKIVLHFSNLIQVIDFGLFNKNFKVDIRVV